MTNQQIENIKTVTAALQSALKSLGLPSSKLGLLLIQVAHETGGFNSHLSHRVNNYSGIKHSTNPKTAQRIGFNSLIQSPEGDYYQGYNYTSDWAKDFIRILSRGTKGTRPIDATGIQSFADSLKRNGYFTDTTTNYINGLNRWKETLKDIFPKIPFPSGIIPQGTLFEIAIIFIILILLNQ